MPTNQPCPRCSHRNEARARFCAQCGLNLSAAGATTPPTPPRPTRRGKWLVLLIVLLGLGLATLSRIRHELHDHGPYGAHVDDDDDHLRRSHEWYERGHPARSPFYRR